jgi:hypothetical protein
MGLRVDLVDRGVYESISSASGAQNKENLQKSREDKMLQFNERDRYLLSDRDDLPQVRVKPEQNELALSRNQSSFDPNSLKNVKEHTEDLVFTGAKTRTDHDLALSQITKTFNSAKRLKVGDQKQGHADVTAVTVSQVLPSFFA